MDWRATERTGPGLLLLSQVFIDEKKELEQLDILDGF